MKTDKNIAVSWGDPAGIGPETILKAFGLLPKSLRNRLRVFGDAKHLRWLDKRLKTGVDIVDARSAKSRQDALHVEHTLDLEFTPGDFGEVDGRFGAAAMESVIKAATAVREGHCAALVTAPINKASVNLAGYHIPGHTEFLAEFCGGAPVAMMLASAKLSVVVATTHVALRDVAARLSANNLENLLILIDGSYRQLSGKRPRIAVCGLNPHAGDGGLFGDEEARIITPAVDAAKRCGIKVTGPYPADTMFTEKARAGYDIALAMYHDQGLVPVKALSFGETVNITLGLPFLRVSVDHGTAFDIAGKNKADPKPMVHAIKTAAKIISGRF